MSGAGGTAFSVPGFIPSISFVPGTGALGAGFAYGGGAVSTGAVAGGLGALGSAAAMRGKPRDNDPDKRIPASEKTAKDMAKQIERDLGRDARREFHDAKEGGVGDRTLEELKADAQALYEQAGKELPPWLK